MKRSQRELKWEAIRKEFSITDLFRRSPLSTELETKPVELHSTVLGPSPCSL